MSSCDGGSFRQPGGNGGAPSATAPAPHNNNNNNNNGVKFAGEESKDKMYEPKHTKKLVRVLTVVAYIFSVSLAAIMLSVYYVFLWQPRDQYALHARLHGGGAAATAVVTTTSTTTTAAPAPAGNGSSPAPAPDQPPALPCECPPPQPQPPPPPQADSAAPTPAPPPPPQPPPQPPPPPEPEQPAPPHPVSAPAPAPDEISTSELNRQQVSTAQTPGGENAEPVEGRVKNRLPMTDTPRASREGQRLHYRSFKNALQV